VYQAPAVVGQAAPAEPLQLTTMGQEVAAAHGCLGCHSLDGTANTGPSWAGLYGREVLLADGKTVVADDAFLTESMMDPMAKLHAGYRPVMPSYLGELQPAETAALVVLIHSLRDVPVRQSTGAPPGLPVPSPSLDGVVGGGR
jgi:cytochrome c oxidase subunit 2